LNLICKGSAIIVSHDRWFLDRLCSHILAFEKNQVLFFEGNYQEYEEDKIKRLGMNLVARHFFNCLI
jgi:sulfate-transporting ATPase